MKIGFFAAAVVALLVAACDSDVGGQTVELKADDMVRGKADAPIMIVEYASLTCPHCAAFNKDVVPELTREYIDPGKVKLVFREFPLNDIDRMASSVVRCFSGDQYFSFLDLLFANQPDWIKDFDGNGMTYGDIIEGLAKMAGQAGMPRDRVEACTKDEKNLALIDANWNEGRTRYNVVSTPTFIINGKTHVGEISFDALKQVIDPFAAR